MKSCSCCGNDLIKGLYVGENWNSEDFIIIKSFWLGEESPYCPSCAINRTKETYFTFENFRKLIKQLSTAYSGGDY